METNYGLTVIYSIVIIEKLDSISCSWTLFLTQAQVIYIISEVLFGNGKINHTTRIVVRRCMNLIIFKLRMDLSTRYLKCVYTPVKQSTSPSHADTIMQIPIWSLLLYELTQDQKQTATRRNHGKCVSLHSCVKERKGGRSDCSVKQL